MRLKGRDGSLASAHDAFIACLSNALPGHTRPSRSKHSAHVGAVNGTAGMRPIAVESVSTFQHT
eukprot:5684459-Pyramimonas_sp.AAC.3